MEELLKVFKKTVSLMMLILLVSIATAAIAQENPCNPCKGKKSMNPCNPCKGKKAMNPCNPCAAKGGMLYYIDDPMKRDTATFISDAPLENIVGTSNQLKGYISFDPARKKGHGEVTIPVASLNSGIPMRDKHIQSADWLDAARYPSITFKFDKVSGIKVLKKTADATTYEGKVHGHFSLHGVKKKMAVPVRFTWMKESQKTKMRAPGDLLAGRAKFTVALADFGVKGNMPGMIGSRVGENVDIEVGFVASNKMMSGGNPCNPCGGKAMNPCNPCNPCAKKKKK